jgi:chloride channel 3/4/5
LLAATTFGLQIPAGIILPSMAIGALYGRAMGMLVQAWQRTHPASWLFGSCQPDIECVTPGTFAIIGAASALGGVTRMTVSIVVITFELTGALTYVLPIMIAVMISKWVGDAFGKRGIYESWIHFKEYPFLDNRDDPVPDIAVADIMTRIEDLVVIMHTGHTIESLREILRSQPPYKGFPVVSDVREARLIGYISRSELRFALKQARHLPATTQCAFSFPQTAGVSLPSTTTAAGVPSGISSTTSYSTVVDMRPWMDHTPFTLPRGSSLSLTATLFQKLGLRYILFAQHGLLQGLLTKKDVFFILNSDTNSGVGGSGGGIGGLDDTGRDDDVVLDAAAGPATTFAMRARNLSAASISVLGSANVEPLFLSNNRLASSEARGLLNALDDDGEDESEFSAFVVPESTGDLM